MTVSKPAPVRLLVEAAINHNAKSELEAKKITNQAVLAEKAEQRSRNMVVEGMMQRESAINRRASFSNNLKATLLSEALYRLFESGIDPDLKNTKNATGMMRSMISTYIDENGASKIIRKMQTASPLLSEMANVLNTHYKKIVEAAAADDSYKVSPKENDDFFASLNKIDYDEIGSSIKDRVAEAISTFIADNVRDKNEIVDTLEITKAKVESIPEEKKELRESYERLGKQLVNKIRRRNKNVFNSMVVEMSESVMHNKDLQFEYMKENGHLDMEKIVNNMAIMYTFMETLNSARLETIDEAYIQEVLDSIKS